MNTAAGDKAAPPVVVTIGNPNTGKSTLFNLLTGLRQKVSNYPGVTVEQVSGTARIDDREIRFVDVPGTYSLSANSPDEIIAVDVLGGNISDLPAPDLVLIVVDATNLRRNLFLATQVLEAGLPAVLVLNMWDRLDETGVSINADTLADKLGIPVIPLSAAKGEGLDRLHQAITGALAQPQISPFSLNQALDETTHQFQAELAAANIKQPGIAVRRALIDEDGYAEQRLLKLLPDPLKQRFEQSREQVAQGRKLATLEARDRYSAIQTMLSACEQRRDVSQASWRDYSDRVVNHPVAGTFLFALLMAVVFQAVFAWAGPLVDAIDYLTGSLAEWARAALGNNLFGSFVADGVIAGVGSVVVFLPQILILFLFIIVLEDSGYMARAAFLMDRLMRGLGLSGQSFIPMLSSFACAVPGIMGTRIIANPSDRLATIMAAPFMTCSARLPVYSLLIAAFVPDQRWLGGVINLQGLVLFGLYALGILGGAFTAWLIGRMQKNRARSRFLLEMPPYRLPQVRAVLQKLLSRALIFLKRAGTIIFVVALVIWVLVTFPRPAAENSALTIPSVSLSESYLGRMSNVVAPLFAPLGWDWKVTAAVIASFPAREVVIAALGTIYAVDDSDEANAERTLTSRIRQAQHPDGSLVYTLPMVIGLLIFYAYCLQCVSTIAVMRRETETWRWPVIAWVYMTGLGYGGAWLAYNGGKLLL